MKPSEIEKHIAILYDAVIEAQYAAAANSAYLTSLLRGVSGAYEEEAKELVEKLQLSQEKLRILRSQLLPP